MRSLQNQRTFSMLTIKITLPSWLDKYFTSTTFSTPEEKMELAITLARENLVQDTGGPFGAAIFDARTGQLISLGVNLVTSTNCSPLHAEIVAFLLAHKKLGHFHLNKITSVELYSSSEPCAMCLGACLWAGIDKVVFGAPASMAREIGFDEGPIFPQSWEYLKNKGIEVQGPFLAEQAGAVLKTYKQAQKIIY